MRDSKKRIHVKKQQVLIIGGGETYANEGAFLLALRTMPVNLDRLRSHKSWKSSLQQELGDRFDVLIPQMPNASNASFIEWSIYFEHIRSLLDDDVILVGHSLGGIFLAAYLSTIVYSLSYKIKALVLIAAPFDKDVNDFFLLPNLVLLEKSCKQIHLFHSTDDPVVPYGEMLKYQSALPNVVVHEFVDRQHFNQEKFPELVALLRTL